MGLAEVGVAVCPLGQLLSALCWSRRVGEVGCCCWPPWDGRFRRCRTQRAALAGCGPEGCRSGRLSTVGGMGLPCAGAAAWEGLCLVGGLSEARAGELGPRGACAKQTRRAPLVAPCGLMKAPLCGRGYLRERVSAGPQGARLGPADGAACCPRVTGPGAVWGWGVVTVPREHASDVVCLDGDAAPRRRGDGSRGARGRPSACLPIYVCAFSCQ